MHHSHTTSYYGKLIVKPDSSSANLFDKSSTMQAEIFAQCKDTGSVLSLKEQILLGCFPF